MLPALFGARNFAVGNWVGFVFQLGMIGIMFVLVLYLQMARGYSAMETGLVVLPSAVLTAVGSAYAGRLADRFGGKYILMAGMTLLAVGLLVLVAMAGPASGVWSLQPGLTIIGIAGGATFVPLLQATMDGVDPRLAGAASGVSGTTRQIGGVLGTAVLGVLLSARLSATLHERGGEARGSATGEPACPVHRRQRRRRAQLQPAHAARRPEPHHEEPVRTRHRRHVRRRLRPRHADHPRDVRRGPGGRRPVLFPVQPAQEAGRPSPLSS